MDTNQPPEVALYAALHDYMTDRAKRSVDDLVQEVIQACSHEFRQDMSNRTWEPVIREYLSVYLAKHT